MAVYWLMPSFERFIRIRTAFAQKEAQKAVAESASATTVARK